MQAAWKIFTNMPIIALCKSQTEKPCCGCAGDHGFQLGELNLPQDKRNVCNLRRDTGGRVRENRAKINLVALAMFD